MGTTKWQELKKVVALERAQAKRLLAKALNNTLTKSDLKNLGNKLHGTGLNTAEEAAIVAGYLVYPDDHTSRKAHILDILDNPKPTK